MPYAACDPFTLDPKLIALLPEQFALKYMVLPYKLKQGVLTLLREGQLSPVALSQIERHTGLKVKLMICAYGVVSLGVRHWYRQEPDLNPDIYLQQCVWNERISKADMAVLQQRYLAGQLSFGDALIQAALLKPSVMNQVLLSYDHQNGQRLGDYLVQEQIVTEDDLAQGMELQKQRRKTIVQLVDEFAPKGEAQLAGVLS